MSAGPCFSITARASEVLSTEEGQKIALRLLEQDAPAEAFIDALASSMEPDTAELLREEFRQLPATMVTTVINAWALAAGAGKDFEFRSATPDRPLEFAGSRRVRFTLDIEEERVAVYLSHIPGRHADWYQPVEAAAAMA